MGLFQKWKDVRTLTRKISELEESLGEKDALVWTLENENASLQERLTGLVFRYKDVESESSAMNFRLYQLTRANKILTMKLTATAAQRDSLHRGLIKMKESARGGNDQ
jgi:chromosome segregation ATPase